MSLKAQLSNIESAGISAFPPPTETMRHSIFRLPDVTKPQLGSGVYLTRAVFERKQVAADLGSVRYLAMLIRTNEENHKGFYSRRRIAFRPCGRLDYSWR